jgi:hypothetical protein
VRESERERERERVKITDMEQVEGVTEEEIEKHIKDYANLLNHIEHMKSFHW